MNTITVTAFGAPNSFARLVQHDPTHAVALFRCVMNALGGNMDSEQCRREMQAALDEIHRALIKGIKE